MGAEANLHKNLLDPELHESKGFAAAVVNDIMIKSERGRSLWESRYLLPAALNIVSSIANPPTEVDQDIYILDAASGNLDVNTIVWQSGTTVRYTFNGSPNLSGYAAGDYLKIISAGQAVNNGTFVITTVNDGADWIEVTNSARTSSTGDEASDSPAVATVTKSTWDGAVQYDWVRYNSQDNKWYPITPKAGYLSYNKNASDYYHFNGTSWVLGITTGDYVLKIGDTMSGNLLFSGGVGIDTTATGGTDTLSIGGTNADVINIGRAGATVNILGSVTNYQATNATITDVLITLNKGGGAGSAVGVGFEIEENSSITGYFKTNAARNGYVMRAPAIGFYADLNLANLTADRVVTFQNAPGTMAYISDITTSQITGVLSIAKGGTNSSAALNNNRMMISSGGAIVEHAGQTSTRIAVYDSNGLPTGYAGFLYDDAARTFSLGAGINARFNFQYSDNASGFAETAFKDSTSGNLKWGYGVLADSYTGNTDLQNAFYVYQYRDKAEAVVNAYRFVINNSGYIGFGSTNPQSKLEINGVGSDNTADGIRFRQPNVAHGLTAVIPTDVYGYISWISPTAGGLFFNGMSDTAGNNGIMFQGILGSDTPTAAAVVIRGMKKNGTTIQALASTEIISQHWNLSTVVSTMLANGALGLGSAASPAAMLEIDGTLDHIRLKQAGVAHGMTGLYPTDVYGGISWISSTVGGMFVQGMTDADGTALLLTGVTGSTTPTTAVTSFRVRKKSGTGGAALAATEIGWQWTNESTSVARMLANGYFGLGMATSPVSSLHINMANAVQEDFLYLSNPNVAHTITDRAPTDVFGTIGWVSNTLGGLHVRGFAESGQSGIVLEGVLGTTTPTDSAIKFWASKKSGTSVTSYAATERMFEFSTGNAKIIIMGDGALSIGTLANPVSFLDLAAYTSARASLRVASATGSQPTWAEGDMYHHGTSAALIGYFNGLKMAYPGVIYEQHTAKTVANDTAETSLLHASTFTGTKTLRANYFSTGEILHIRASGLYSATATPNLTIRVKIGSNADSTVYVAPTVTNCRWEIDIILYCQAAGAGGNLYSRGWFEFEQTSFRSGSTKRYPAGAGDIGVDTTASKTIDVTAQWSAASASNTITCDTVIIERKPAIN